MEKKEFINKVLVLARQSLEPELLKGNIQCYRISKDDFNSYIEGAMPISKQSLFEKHCLECIFCAVRLSQSWESFILEQEIAENKMIFERTIDLLDRLEQQKQEDVPDNIMRIVIEAVQNAFRVVLTTGEILKPGFAIIMRGVREESTKDNTIQILQEFSHPDISIQAMIIKDKTEQATLQLSLFDRTSDAFMPDIEMHLIGASNILQKEVSDNNGAAKFQIHIPGDYLIDVLTLSELLTRIYISIKKSAFDI